MIEGNPFNLPLETRESFGIFVAYRNDILIHVEDDDKAEKEFYLVLLKEKLLIGTDIILNDVVPLGAKNDVIKACKDYLMGRQNSKDMKLPKHMYICDSDMELLTGYAYETDELYYWECYCVENLVIDFDALVEVIHTESGSKSREQIKKDMQWESWFAKSFIECLMQYWYLYALLKLKVEAKTINDEIPKRINWSQCYQKNSGFPLKESSNLENEKQNLITIVKKHNLDNELKLLENKYSFTRDNFFKVISAKGFLYEIILDKCIEKKISGRIREVFKFKLLKACDEQILKEKAKGFYIKLYTILKE